MPSTVEKGDEFRDTIAALMRASGYKVETEVWRSGKKIDVLATKNNGFIDQVWGIEAKSYSGNLPASPVREFIIDYGMLIADKSIDMGILVSSTPISTAGIAALEGAKDQRLLGREYVEFQHSIFGPQSYLSHLIDDVITRELGLYYIPSRLKDGRLLENALNELIANADSKPLVVLGGYGSGKSTFSADFAAKMATRALLDPHSRIPIIIDLGDLVDEQSLEGLIGKIFTSRFSVNTYNYTLFRHLNRLGRFVLILDGFDEMKHGMTFNIFERQFEQLLKLAEGEAKVVILGRPNAFKSDTEFRAIIQGRITTSSGTEVKKVDRVECSHVEIDDFDTQESHEFVEKYYQYLKGKTTSSDRIASDVIQSEVDVLKGGDYKDIISKPVHAKMLCEIASDDFQNIRDLDTYALYDKFIYLLLKRECDKPGRYPGFDVSIRRQANAALSWWLLSKSGASTTSLYDVPESILNSAIKGAEHHFDKAGLAAELISGCLVEKSGGTVYFSHRSIQEFLAAEHLFESAFLQNDTLGAGGAIAIGRSVTNETIFFLRECYARRSQSADSAHSVLTNLGRFSGSMPLSYLEPYTVPIPYLQDAFQGELPWLFWLNWVNRFGQPRGYSSDKDDWMCEAIASKAFKDDDMLCAAIAIIALECSIELPTEVPKSLLRLLFDVNQLEPLIHEARSRSVTVTPKELKTFFLVKCVQVITLNGEKFLTVDLDHLLSIVGEKLRYGPISERINRSRTARARIPALGVYRALGLSTQVSDKIRPFFNDPAVLPNMNAVEVRVRRSRNPWSSQPE